MLQPPELTGDILVEVKAMVVVLVLVLVQKKASMLASMHLWQKGVLQPKQQQKPNQNQNQDRNFLIIKI